MNNQRQHKTPPPHKKRTKNKNKTLKICLKPAWKTWYESTLQPKTGFRLREHKKRSNFINCAEENYWRKGEMFPHAVVVSLIQLIHFVLCLKGQKPVKSQSVRKSSLKNISQGKTNKQNDWKGSKWSSSMINLGDSTESQHASSWWSDTTCYFKQTVCASVSSVFYCHESH